MAHTFSGWLKGSQLPREITVTDEADNVVTFPSSIDGVLTEYRQLEKKLLTMETEAMKYVDRLQQLQRRLCEEMAHYGIKAEIAYQREDE